MSLELDGRSWGVVARVLARGASFGGRFGCEIGHFAKLGFTDAAEAENFGHLAGQVDHGRFDSVVARTTIKDDSEPIGDFRQDVGGSGG